MTKCSRKFARSITKILDTFALARPRRFCQAKPTTWIVPRGTLSDGNFANVIVGDAAINFDKKAFAIDWVSRNRERKSWVDEVKHGKISVTV